MLTRVVGHAVGQQRPASCHVETHRSPRSRERHQQVAADITLEVDREIVAARSPAPRASQQPDSTLGASVPRQPGGIERLHAVDLPDQAGKRLVPRADHEIDGGFGSQAAHLPDGAERHQQVPDAFEPQEQHRRPAAGGSPNVSGTQQWRDDGQRKVGETDETTLSGIGNLKMREQCSRLRARNPYSTSTRSTITPRSRSSGMPSAARGFQVLQAIFSLAGSSFAAIAAARSGGIANE